MARTKGSKNKNSSALPDYATLPTEDRVKVLANLIVIKSIEEDIVHTEEGIKKLQEERDIRSTEKPLDFAVVKQYLKYFSATPRRFARKTD